MCQQLGARPVTPAAGPAAAAHLSITKGPATVLQSLPSSWSAHRSSLHGDWSPSSSYAPWRVRGRVLSAATGQHADQSARPHRPRCVRAGLLACVARRAPTARAARRHPRRLPLAAAADAFYAQVEVQRDPARLAGQPVAVVQYNPVRVAATAAATSMHGSSTPACVHACQRTRSPNALTSALAAAHPQCTHADCSMAT